MEIIDYSDLEMGKFLGQGAEGTVHAAWYLETPVAVKQTSSVQEIEMNLHAGMGQLPALTTCPRWHWCADLPAEPPAQPSAVSGTPAKPTE